MGRERLALLARPQNGRARRVGALGGAFRSLDQGRERHRRRRVRAAGDGQERREPVLQPVEQVGRVRVRLFVLRQLGPQPIDARRWRRAAQALPLEPARGSPARGGSEAERRQRVLQHRQQSDRRQPLADGAGQQAQQRCRRRVRERLAGTVIHDHAIARELGCHPERKSAVRRDERGARLRPLERVPQRQRDRDGLLLLIGGLQPEQAADLRGERVAPLREGAGGKERTRDRGRPRLSLGERGGARESARSPGPNALTQPSPGGRGLFERSHISPGRAHPRQQALHARLRVAIVQ